MPKRNFYLYSRCYFKCSKVLTLVVIICFGLLMQACAPNLENTVSSSMTVNATPKATSQTTPGSSIAGLATTPALAQATPLLWQKEWLSGLPCRLPCFQNIIPGQTTAQEATKALQQNPLVAVAQIVDHAGKNYDNYVRWDWKDGTKSELPDITYGGTASYSPKAASGIIYLIEPNLGTPVELGEVIKAFGQPSHIIVGKRRVGGKLYFGVQILYLPLGMTLFPRGTTTKPTIDENLTFSSVNFFAPTLKGYKLAFPGQEYQQLVAWEGYKSYDHYCAITPDGTGDCSYQW